MPQQTQDQSHIVGTWFSVATWILVLAIAGYFFNDYLEREKNPNQQVQSSVRADGTREVTLRSNRQGHYLATGHINGHPVEIMLDTGASNVAVPQHLARQLGIHKGRSVEMITANGMAKGYATTITDIRIGDIRLRNVKASLYPAVDDTVLVGMSFLKYLEFTQREDTLILRQ